MDASQAKGVDKSDPLNIVTKQLDAQPSASGSPIRATAELVLLIAVWVMSKRRPQIQEGETSEDPPQPRKYELRFLAFMGRHTDGTATLPDPEAEETKARMRRRPLEQTLGEFEAVATKSEERGRAAMTASVFVMTIASVLVTSKSHVSAHALAISGVGALLGFFAGLLGQGFYVGRRPMHDIGINDLRNAITFTIRKEFYAQVSMLIAALALAIEVVAFFVAYV